jgi:GAF domain-containing protein
MLDRQTIHVHDMKAEEIGIQFPDSEAIRDTAGTRTILAIPLLREGNAIGAIVVRRENVSEKQIALLTTFANQAVIAIENARLFQELQERNRELIEALEQQTASGEVLRVIASSPTELQPVLDTLIANAVKLSGATKGHIRQIDGDLLRVVADYGETPEEVRLLRDRPLKLGRRSPSSRAFLERKPFQLSDAQTEFGPNSRAVQGGMRTVLAVPLLREGVAIGTITIWRNVVEPFIDRQIALLQTFADQAVIAVENVRLFQELKESLEQQTATSEILGVIASSPTDIQPVLDTVTSSAIRLCDASDAVIIRLDGPRFFMAAHSGLHEPPLPEVRCRSVAASRLGARCWIKQRS